MKLRLFILAAAIAAFGIGISQATASRDSMSASNDMHHIFGEWAYFSDSGFSSHPEDYVINDKAAEQVIASVNAEEVMGMPAGHEFTKAEYLYFSGKGFATYAN